MQKIIANMIVVNDPAERAIGLIKEINNTLVKDPEQQNQVIQVVENFNKNHEDRNKSTIIKNLI